MRKIKVLILTDEEMVAALIEGLFTFALNKAGVKEIVYKKIIHKAGRPIMEGLIYLEHGFDVAFIDVDLNGYPFKKAIDVIVRIVPKETDVFIISGTYSNRPRAEALRYGFIEKPSRGIIAGIEEEARKIGRRR